MQVDERSVAKQQDSPRRQRDGDMSVEHSTRFGKSRGRRGRSIVAVRKLTKVYGRGATRVVALKSVSLRVRKGELVAVVGPSGSGKTTLLNMLGALDRPTTGQVFIDGVETSRVAESQLYRIRRHKLGFIFQTYYLVPTLTALQNVLTPVLPISGNSRYRRRAEGLLKMVGLGQRMHHKPGELSGGEQQRVAIARALIMNPGVILADEPTGNLDSKSGRMVFELMKRLSRSSGTAFVMVTHDDNFALEADRVIRIRDGRIQEPSAAAA